MSVIIRNLGLKPYLPVLQDMQNFTDQRKATTPDELWVVQHPPVYTLGKNGKKEHIKQTGDISVVQTDRGGQVTYHGPGQLVIYTLLDINRLKIGVRQLVTDIEKSIIALLAQYHIDAQAKCSAPGVYVADRKIAALGLRVRKGCCFHGLALNVDMDLQPYSGINPCGYEGLEVTQLSEFVNPDFDTVTEQLLLQLQQQLKLSTDTSLELRKIA